MAHNPVITIVDDAGLPLKTIVNGDGTASLAPIVGVTTTVITYPLGVQALASAGVSFSTAVMSGLAVDISLTGFTGGSSPSITFFVDRLGSDGVWYRVWTSAALTGAGVTSVSIGLGASTAAVLTGTARFGWSTSGAPTAVTFSASVTGQ